MILSDVMLISHSPKYMASLVEVHITLKETSGLVACSSGIQQLASLKSCSKKICTSYVATVAGAFCSKICNENAFCFLR